MASDTEMTTTRTELDGYSAANARMRGARIYLSRIRPGILVFVTALTLVSWLADKESMPVALWLICATFWLMQILWVLLLRTSINPMHLAGASIVTDTLIEMVALNYSPDPLGASAALCFLVVAAAYFLPAVATLGFGVLVGGAITASTQFLDSWGTTEFQIPSSAFAAVAVAALCAFVMSRVRKTEQILEQIAIDEQIARERLELMDKSRNRLLANVSHELRTPLTTTVGAIDTLLRNDVNLSSEHQRALLNLAQNSGHRLIAIIEDLLTIGSTQPEALKLNIDPQRLSDVVDESVMGLDAGEKRAITTNLIDDPTLSVDRLRIVQVLSNLVTNAIKHGQGDIEIRAEAKDGTAKIAVLDDGPGVPTDHINEIFQPFARFSNRADSTGLGLSICRTIVEAHSGNISYTRTDEGRTAFTIELPVTTKESQSE